MTEGKRSTDPEPPAAVEEAEEAFANYRVRVGLGWLTVTATGLLVGTQVFGTYWTDVLGYMLPVSVGAAGLITYPLGKGIGRARRILRRWEEIRTELALMAPPHADPRVRAANMLADRIREHPRSGPETLDVVRRLGYELESAVADLSAVEAARHANEKADDATDSRTGLELRIARLLSGLGELHHALTLRDDVRVKAELGELQDLLGQLHAEVEVEALLGRAPSTDET